MKKLLVLVAVAVLGLTACGKEEAKDVASASTGALSNMASSALGAANGVADTVASGVNAAASVAEGAANTTASVATNAVDATASAAVKTGEVVKGTVDGAVKGAKDAMKK